MPSVDHALATSAAVPFAGNTEYFKAYEDRRESNSGKCL
jgi:hypothetical protein